MKNLSYKGLILLIIILVLILVSLIAVKSSYKTYIIWGDCTKFDYKYKISLKYKNEYENHNTDQEYILTNNMLGLDTYIETITQRKDDFEGIKNSYQTDNNLSFFKDFELENGMTGYAYSSYGNLKVVLILADAYETDNDSIKNYILLNEVIKSQNGFEISDYETVFNINQNLLKTVEYTITEYYQ